MPPGSRVAPGSDRATLRSWVSSRVASAYGWGVGSAGCMNWRMVSAAKVTIAPSISHCPPAARKPGWVIGLSPLPIRVPPTTSATAATPSSAAPSVGRRRNAAVSSGTAR